MFVSDEQVRACTLSTDTDSYFCTRRGETFLRQFTAYCEERTDAPMVYHLAVGLTLLAAATPKEFALGNTFGGVTYPNLYAMILGPSGARKTHAASMGFDQIFARALPQRVGNLPGSYEGLLESLAERPSQCLFDPEMSRFYRQSRGEGGHLGPLKQGLTDVYDCKKISRQTRKVKIQPQDIHRLNIIGCIALDEFEANVEATDITGGFVSRFLLAVGTRTRAKKLEVSPSYRYSADGLAAHLRWISNACPQNLASLSQGATDYLNDVGSKWDTVTQGVDLRRWASIWERAPAMARKIALLLALDRYALNLDVQTTKNPVDGSTTLYGTTADQLPPVIIEVEDARKAVEITQLFVAPAVQLVDRLPTSRQAREIQAVRRAVETTSREAHRHGVPGATFGAISREAGTNRRTTTHMLETLQEQGLVKATPCDRGTMLYNMQVVQEGVDPSWMLFSGGFDPQRPPQLVTSSPLPENVVAFPSGSTPASAPTGVGFSSAQLPRADASEAAELKRLGLLDD